MDQKEIEKLGWKCIGEVGVNVGCVMIVDPSEVLNRTEYQEFMKRSEECGDDYFQMKKGMVVPTAWGDGNYHIFIQERKGDDGFVRVERVLIEFTSTYGYTDRSKSMHDISMEDLYEAVVKRQSEQKSDQQYE